MTEERLFRVSHQVDYDDPSSAWHSILFLYPRQGSVVSHYYVCTKCRRWRMYNPKMSSTLKNDYQGLWEYWRKKRAKKSQQKLIPDTAVEKHIQLMYKTEEEEEQIPFLWLEEPDTYKIVVEPESELDDMFVESSRYAGWKLYILTCKTAYGLPIRIVMSFAELSMLKSRLRGNFGREVIFERKRKEGMRRQVSANDVLKKQLEDKTLEERIKAMGWAQE